MDRKGFAAVWTAVSLRQTVGRTTGPGTPTHARDRTAKATLHDKGKPLFEFPARVDPFGANPENSIPSNRMISHIGIPVPDSPLLYSEGE
jgi:hypothetical protein